MLVLSRKVGESIVIDDKVIVTVLGIVGSRVRLGIKASADVPVHRSEVHESLAEERRKHVEPGHRTKPVA